LSFSANKKEEKVAVHYLHGLETIELSDGLRPVRTIKTSVIGLVGTAPLADANLFPLNTPVALFADPAKAQKLGIKGTLLDAVNAVYSQGSATVVVVRVAEGANERETWSNAVGSVTAKTGVWALLKARAMLKVVPKLLAAPGLTAARPGNGIVSAVVATQGANYAAGTTKLDFEAAPAGGRTAQGTVQVVGGQVTGITITDPGYGYKTAPAGTISGAGTGATVKTTLGTVPNPVAKAIEAVTKRLRAVAFVDGPGTSYEDAVAYRNDFGSDRVMILDPGVLVYDSAISDYVVRPASAYAAGLQARIDREEGFWFSFSNHEILNIGGPSRPVDFMYSDADAEANQLNENEITTIIHDDGFRFWGLRSTAQDLQWSFLAVRRTADAIYESLEQAHRAFLDKPFGSTLLSSIEDSVNAYLLTLKRRGALIGGKCKIDPYVNTKDTLLAGELYVDFDLEPPAPLEHLIFQARRNPAYYTDFIEDFASQVSGVNN